MVGEEASWRGSVLRLKFPDLGEKQHELSEQMIASWRGLFESAQTYLVRRDLGPSDPS